MNSLTISGLHKAYQKTIVLRGISLVAPDATLTAVLGASGSGKTTLLRVVAGFERAGQGEIKLGDRMLEGSGKYLPPELRGIGYVSQDGSLFPHLSVGDNVAFGLARRERRGRRVEELLDLVGLSGLGRRFPHQLSGGEQQRVSLARALAPRPRLILMDEPFSALDAGLRVSLRADVRTVLSETGVTVILVTHDQDEALSLADQIAVLRDGTIVQTGTPKQVYERPVDQDLAQFVGHANFLDGTLDRGRARTAFGLLSLANQPLSREDGTPVLIMLRPEQIKVALSEASRGLAATIVHCEYFGHDAVMTVSPLESLAPGGLVLRVPGHEALSAGTKVWLHFQGEALAFFR
jgi:iron(III) transport system ATP-binding protein